MIRNPAVAQCQHVGGRLNPRRGIVRRQIRRAGDGTSVDRLVESLVGAERSQRRQLHNACRRRLIRISSRRRRHCRHLDTIDRVRPARGGGRPKRDGSNIADRRRLAGRLEHIHHVNKVVETRISKDTTRRRRRRVMRFGGGIGRRQPGISRNGGTSVAVGG